MNYQILARKWRPQSFQDIIGQAHIVTAISNELSLNRIHHSWLLSGTRGVGKTTIARLLAKSLNCQKGITANPCRKCIICQEIEKGLCLDFLEIDAASRTKVEDIREILDNIYYSPVKSRFKIYLIDEVHMLSRHSFNALLKTLEEPPKHIKFILATTDIEKIPKTIISRCLYFKFKILSEENIFNLLTYILRKECIKFDNNSLRKISNHAKGSIRDALNLLEHGINLGNGIVNIKNITNMLGIPAEKHSFLLTDAVLKKDVKKTMFLLNEISNIGVEWEEVLIEMLHLLYQINMSQSLPLEWEQSVTEIYKNEIKKIGKNINKNKIQLCYQILINGRKELKFSPSQKIGVEMTLLRAIDSI
ncbi:DNA polymerase III subunit gamma/tau [Buchnera aphidicola]|uniref:DNA polymerase III subunit gamma/tau n=1 Tax=Buchnera aphidicola str. USDA (Myzus persicae) TaxID=1009856 RepID=W0NZJ8_BUCMP|nr:DNA polymerase III subunit gamma/tau [Buchnera aphidicola]AHG59916.1 Dnax [Buchnera aphidicola str. USDA (Myzus persicae)]AHG60496.1 Dnax [Buchnera aphidicola str. W106 (Myzus persicae)]AHG61069.1 Dnax [Buchnera aphidicola str. G002 (Myzus persicae)]AHG61641.1 Dnax [Buchnera aphidicola str. F009 (Myzus persicae)]WAI02845.1 MAG: DNA polymerase III subunit gamma/tau [Buchnera aphidicola (Myzus persicae)]